MRKRFHSLKKPKIRADWSRETLYNISRAAQPNISSKTFFQQKWAAKAATRAYHGEQIGEKHWQRMFRRTLPAVVPMNHIYLSRNDGSEQATGRGSGEEVAPDVEMNRPRMTPYMHMTFYPVEKRLDNAIWRALFASSVRQARQFVVHGWVKVNGKKMVHPSYMLNPGDMFQVDPDRVMWATGARKDEWRYIHADAVDVENQPATQRAPKTESMIPDEDAEPSPETEGQAEAETKAEAPASGEEPASGEDGVKEKLNSLIERTKAMLADTKELSAKRKQEFRSFQQALKKMRSRAYGISTTVIDDLEAHLASISAKVAKDSAPLEEPTAEEELSEEQEKLFAEAMEMERGNALDPSKPYLTPWRPRPYMPAFAFIPRYLEVNQNICAAVYLRHPVARPGLAEVPTPFHYETSQLAFNWYLRRS